MTEDIRHEEDDTLLASFLAGTLAVSADVALTICTSACAVADDKAFNR